MTEQTKQQTALNTDQQARGECIRVAREAIQNRASTGAFSSSRGDLPKYRDITDLVDVAQYIETGKHPFDRYPDDGEDAADE